MKEFDYDMISRYLDGEMEGDELKDFEEQIQLDKELQNEVELFRDVNRTLQIKLYPDEQEKGLRNTFSALKEEYFQSAAKVVTMRRYRWISAAAAILIAAIVLTVWTPWKKNIYEQYAYTQMPGVAERGTSNDSLLLDATTNFNNKKFAVSIPSFEAILKKDAQNSFVHFYYGVALLESGEAGKARQELIQLYNGNSLFRYEAAFYMALSYLKEKDKITCKEWLNKIPADAAIYGKAQQLLKQL